MPSEFYLCSAHGPYSKGTLCPDCFRGWSHVVRANYLDVDGSDDVAVVYNLENRYSLMSLGRWETLTDFDRDFLRSINVSPD